MMGLPQGDTAGPDAVYRADWGRILAARAFLVAGPIMAQRLVRAKRKFAMRGSRTLFRGRVISARFDAILTVIYLVFNEGYAAKRRGARGCSS